MSRRPADTDVAQHTRRPLFRGMGMCIDDFQCRAHVEATGKEEPNPTHSIVFVRRGMFVRSDRRETFVADATQVLYFNQGEPYRYAHPLPGGDDCTILMLDDERARTATERLLRRGGRNASCAGPFPLGHALATPRAARLHHELLAVSPGESPGSELEIEEVVAELVEDAIGTLARAIGTGRRRSEGRTNRHRELADAARLMLIRSIARPPSLVALAATLDCSPFHLSRVFRATTGLALRQYVRRLRVLLAAEHLRRGTGDLTSLALELGFYDHSHFTNAFRREWGVPPSRVRQLRSGAFRREHYGSTNPRE